MRSGSFRTDEAKPRFHTVSPFSILETFTLRLFVIDPSNCWLNKPPGKELLNLGRLLRLAGEAGSLIRSLLENKHIVQIPRKRAIQNAVEETGAAY